MQNGGKSSERRPRVEMPKRGVVDQGQIQRSLREAAVKREPSLAELEADQEEVEALALEVNTMCRERGIVIEAQVVIQGTQMVSNVVFRKRPRE
jgi:hypothetical protein